MARSCFIHFIISISDFIHVYSLSYDGVHDIFIQISCTMIPLTAPPDTFSFHHLLPLPK